MKNKPQRHKADNTFKFQPFAERISNIDVDIFHRVPHAYEVETEELECYFHQTLQKWNVLNLTESYDNLRKEVIGIVTLPQLLHKKEFVVETLLHHLKLKNSLSLQPTLELVVALSKDLQKEFYPYYLKFLNQLIEILNTKDTDVLEWTFVCLAYLFKNLWRYLIKDINVVFVSLLPLLSNKKPVYVNNFAAESFAFVARKVKDRSAFLALILTAVQTEKDGITGCGKLLFEVINGVQNTFHSCAEQTLQFYFDSLLNEELPKEILFDVLQEVLKNISYNIKPKNTEVFWKTIIIAIEKCLSSQKIQNNLEYLLKLLIQMLSHKEGKVLTSLDLTIKLYLKLLQVQNLPENLLLLISKFGSLLINSQNIQVPQEIASNIVRKSLSFQNELFKLDFIRNLITYSQFEAMILPSFLTYFKNNLNDKSLKFLTEIIINKAPISYNGIVLPNWTKYNLDFGHFNDPVLNYMLDILNYENLHSENLHKVFYVLICLPHLKMGSNGTENAVKSLKTLFLKHFDEKIKESQNDCERLKYLFFAANVLSSLSHLMSDEDFYNFCVENHILDQLLEFVNEDGLSLVVLNMVDLILTATRSTEIISMKNLLVMHEKLVEFFASPFKEIRLVVSHIFSLFESLPELTANSTLEKPEDWNVFSICYNVENTESLVQTYRDQLQNLQKIAHDKPQGILCKNTEFYKIPLKYLLGVLYINFQLLWEPVINIVTTYAQGMTINVFWEVFSKKLFETDEHIKGYPLSEINLGLDCDVINNLCTEIYKIESTPDYMNYRQLLWKAMCEFPEIAEARNRDIAPLMLKFVDEEYRGSNASEALVWNIKKNNNNVSMSEDISDQADNEENEDQSEEKDENNLNESEKPDGKTEETQEPSEKFSKSSKTNLKTLLQQLTLFSKMRNPKNLHREPELNKLYLELLSHRNSEVQRVALDCIMVYKHKYLVPYKENLYNLIDDKSFKNELQSFKIDKDDSTIQETHRDDLIPIVMRIVFSKMMVKTGLRTGGKAAGQMRRSLVLRFLAGCQESEMQKFVEMIFKYYTKFLLDNPLEMVTKVTSEIDLENCIPTKRLQSTLNLIQVILDQFGGLMSNEILGFVLKILFVICATVFGVLKQSSTVHPGYLNSIKSLRSMSLTIFKRFFDQFDTYPWSNNEINALFYTSIWPSLDKLSIENVNSPTPMLKLLSTWCQNPRYYVLLVKSNVETNSFALKQIINLLMADKIHPSVLGMLIEMFEKLLLLKPDEDTVAIQTDNVLPIETKILERISVDEKLNYGSCILLPFVPQILLKLKKKLSNKNKGINAKETFILSRISELVWEPEMCDTVLALLLPIVIKKATSGASQEILLQLVTTVLNLIKIVQKPRVHIRSLAPLFCEITSSNCRKLLCDILKVISTKSGDEIIERMSNVMAEINAFDKRWIDQPDFERRLDGFKEVNTLVTNDKLDLELGAIVIYNCFNFIKEEKDLALRESSDLCLRSTVPYLINKFDSQVDKNYLINDILLDLVRRGINNKNEAYRHEAISLLGHMARECPNSHVVLSDLSKLSNKVDLEVDFFENLLHLQLYRQTRALNKFAQIYHEIKQAPNVRSLTQFLLPLTSAYLLTEKFAQKNSLIDSSIEAVKTICKLLPWYQYESVLKFYLGKLRHKREFQKQLVKIVVAVLDAYHFDLSKAQVQVKLDVPKVENEISKEKLETEAKDQEEPTEVQEMFSNDDNDEEVLDEEVEQELPEEILPINRITNLCPSAAKRVIHSIQHVLLPQLNKTMAELTQHDQSHKVNRKKVGIDHEEEELQKVPISLAVVKLLQRLPKQILDRNLPGIFMKLCSFFQSHLESVRRATREILQKIMVSLGTDYLPLLLREMSSMLSRGFQTHVLVYTVHSVLVCLKDLFKPEDIDKCLLTILDLCKNDLFGIISEEKEVAKIGSKVSEAKSTKSFDTFQILGQYSTEKCLMDLILPLKDILTQTHSFKIVNKVQEALRRIVLGLIDNTYISTNSLLMFAYGTSSESIPQFLSKNSKKKLTDEERERKLREKPDCYIIPAAPVGRSGVRIKNVCSNAETNSHLLVEFGLRLCYFLLKRDKIQTVDYISFLDPFVLVFKNTLTSRHVKMCTLTIQCLGLIVRYEIPSLKEHMGEISKSIFELLHKYAAAGLSKGDNFDLVVASFKTMAILVRDVKYYNIETDQLKALLLYAEQDLHDFERQATAFGLLKAIISRKLIIPEIHEVMKKVSELSITSDLPHVRQHCRQVFHQFLMDYPLGKKLDNHLAFYMSQLNYEDQPGRESALEMVQSIISTFPVDILKKQAGMFYVLLGARLVNDEAPECRKMVAKCLQVMLERLNKTDRDKLFEITKSWFEDQKISHRRLAAQLCGIFVIVEKTNFEKRLPEIRQAIIKQFTGELDHKGPGRFVKVKNPDANEEDDDKDIKPQDHNLFQVLQMLLKICGNCPSFLNDTETIETLSTHIQALLAYPHEWVRLGAAQFIGYVLSVLNIERLSTLLTNQSSEPLGYLYSDPQGTVKSLTLDLCDQLQAGAIKSELAEQVVKNLVFMARVLQNVPNENVVDKKLINLHWLTRRMRKIVNMEVVIAPKSTVLRTEVFKWIAGVATTLEKEKIKEEVHNLLAPLVREMTTTEPSNAPLRQLAKEVANIIKKKVGNEEYIKTVSAVQMQLNVKRAERKRERKQLAITEPEVVAKKKIKMHEKKKEAKKRKIEGFKGKKPMKKKRKVDEVDDEIM